MQLYSPSLVQVEQELSQSSQSIVVQSKYRPSRQSGLIQVVDEMIIPKEWSHSKHSSSDPPKQVGHSYGQTSHFFYSSFL